MATRSQLKKRLDFDGNLLQLLSGAPQSSQFFWPLKQTPIWAAVDTTSINAADKKPSHQANPAPPATANVAPLATGADTATTTPLLIGIDEVGRGCLAGPVVAAAVVLPKIMPRSKEAKALATINDSKLISADERERLSVIIMSIAEVAIAEASVEEIDTINILQASLLAMKRAREKLSLATPAVLAIDGNKHVLGLADIQVAVIKGDQLSASIAAASIVAKVYRDKLMTELSLSFPKYQWQSNKGYGSLEHRQAIAEHGQCPWHRKSFVVKSLIEDEDE